MTAPAGKTKRRKSRGANKSPACPHCRSADVVPVIYGTPTTETQKKVNQGRAVLSDCADWEGQPEWHCNECGCEWRGEWRRFKRSAADSA